MATSSLQFMAFMDANRQSLATPTLLDIAKSLGLSQSTISRALHNNPRISLRSREKIQTVAAQMGYRPDPLAVGLGQRRYSHKQRAACEELAWLNSWEKPEQLRQFKEFDLYFQGASRVAEKYGYHLEEFRCDHRMTALRLETILRARNIRGILIPPHRGLFPALDRFNWDKFCAVRLGYSLKQPLLHIVTSNQLADSLLAFENIRKNGYTRIGFVTHYAEQTKFKAGFLLAQSELSSSAHVPPLILRKSESNEKPPIELVAWLKKHSPDAILTDVMNLREILERAKYRIPEDIGFAALSILDGKADAGLYQNSEEIGKTAVETLISLINLNQYGVPSIYREILIEGQWVNGSTLPSRSGIPAEAHQEYK